MEKEKRMDTVLVVDDDHQILRLICKFLGRKGIRAVSTSDSNKAVEMCRKYKPNLVLLDIIMPGLGGTEVLRLLKSEFPNIPVVIISAVQDELLARTLLTKKQVMDYLLKPFDLDVLERIVMAGIAVGG